MKRQNWLLIFVLAAVISLSANLYSFFKPSPDQRYPLLAKRLFVSNPNDLLINFTGLRSELRDYIGTQDVLVGLYFEYLPTGTSININGNSEFFRASLIKLPGIMRTYKLIEEGKLSETDILEVKPADVNPLYGGDKLPAGSKRTVADLVELALTESNNTAYQVIFDRVNNELLGGADNDEKNIREVYDYLDIPRSDTGETLFVSPKNYASILKSLYFSAYISYDNSSKLLDYLTKSTFNDWLPKPIPTDVKIAHKFGVYDLEKPAEAQVHSDCGIVYLTQRPYIVCVMVNSPDRTKSASIIQTISGDVYRYLTAADRK